jgi:hypothetical protein
MVANLLRRTLLWDAPCWAGPENFFRSITSIAPWDAAALGSGIAACRKNVHSM